MTSEQTEVLADEVNESLGINQETKEDLESQSDATPDELPEVAKKRLGMQSKRHKKEMRKMQEQLNEMKNYISSNAQAKAPDQVPQYNGEGQQQPGSMDDMVYQAVSKAMEVQKHQEHQAKEAEKMKYVQKAYQNMQDHLDDASTKYDDFDDVVKAEDAPYTDAIRDAALLIDNAPDVLYHLGKNREKLQKISDLHPLEQAKEVIKLSVALMAGKEDKNPHEQAKPLGQVKHNPMNSSKVNETTTVGELRKRMREGGKRWG